MNKSNLLANIVFVITILLISKITLFFLDKKKEVIFSGISTKPHQVVLSDKLNVNTIDGDTISTNK
jgi:hypothetical protein